MTTVMKLLDGRPYIVLCRYKPVEFESKSISEWFDTKLYHRLDGRPEVRTPRRNNDLHNSTVNGWWHRDNFYSAGSSEYAACWLLLWCTQPFTQLRVIGNSCREPDIEPLSVVLIDNHKCLHRQPPYNPTTYPPERWLYRLLDNERELIPIELRVPDLERKKG